MIDVYTNVLEEHNAIWIDDKVKKISWKYDYSSEPSKPNKHWHVFCGHNKEECDQTNYGWADSLFNMFVNGLLTIWTMILCVCFAAFMTVCMIILITVVSLMWWLSLAITSISLLLLRIKKLICWHVLQK